MALTTVDAFVELVRKSDLVEADRLSAYLDKLKGSKELVSEPQRLAELLVRDCLLTKFQTDQLLAGKWKGFHVGKYKVLELLGTGGMGKVYLAEHKFMRRRVALKVLPRSRVASDSSLLERFYREAKALGALDHPNIVRAYDHDHENELHFLVMEFVDGPSLQDMIRIGGPISWNAAVHYLYQGALGLQHAHEVGLVHRDIKPGNLLVDRGGTVKILDMGLARFFRDEEDMLTKKYDENVLGTADYLAPEQAIDSHNVDIRDDIYSLGGTIYFTLTGQSPFGEGTVAQKLIWHQTRRPRSLKEIRPQTPDALVDIIGKMMAKEVGDRYQVPGDVARAVEPLLQGASPPPPEEQMPILSPLSRIGLGTETTPPAPSSRPNPTAKPAPNPALTKSNPPPGAPAADEAKKTRVSPVPSNPAPPVGGGKPPAAEPVFGQRSQPATPQRPPSTPPPHDVPEPLPVPDTPTGGGDWPDLAAEATPLSPVPKKRPPTPTSTPAPAFSPPQSDNPFAWNTAPATTRGGVTRGKSKTSARSVVTLKKQKVVLSELLKKRWLWIGVGVGVLLVVVVGIVLFLVMHNRGDASKSRASSSPSGATKPPAPADTLFVSRGKVEPGDVETIAEALKKVKEDSRLTKIVLRPDTYEEALRLNRANVKANLVIEAPPGDDGLSAVIVPPKNLGPTDPLLQIDSGATVKLKGLVFDGQKKVDTLAIIRGNCNSMVLEDVHLRGFRKVGLLLDNCQGGTRKGQEATFRGLRCDTQMDKAQAALAIVDFKGGGQSAANQNLIFQGCRFEGPCDATVRFEGNALVRNCTFQNNLFYRGLHNAFAYPKDVAAGTSLIGLRIVNNTICDYQCGFMIQQQLDILASGVELENNLFYRIAQGVGVVAGTVTPENLAEIIVGAGNIRDTKSPEGNWQALPKFKLQAVTFELPMKSKDAPDFLRFPKTSELATAGNKKSHVGAFPPMD